jgi:hypothetical protein
MVLRKVSEPSDVAGKIMVPKFVYMPLFITIISLPDIEPTAEIRAFRLLTNILAAHAFVVVRIKMAMIKNRMYASS